MSENTETQFIYDDNETPTGDLSTDDSRLDNDPEKRGRWLEEWGPSLVPRDIDIEPEIVPIDDESAKNLLNSLSSEIKSQLYSKRYLEIFRKQTVIEIDDDNQLKEVIKKKHKKFENYLNIEDFTFLFNDLTLIYIDKDISQTQIIHGIEEFMDTYIKDYIDKTHMKRMAYSIFPSNTDRLSAFNVYSKTHRMDLAQNVSNYLTNFAVEFLYNLIDTALSFKINTSINTNFLNREIIKNLKIEDNKIFIVNGDNEYLLYDFQTKTFSQITGDEISIVKKLFSKKVAMDYFDIRSYQIMDKYYRYAKKKVPTIDLVKQLKKYRSEIETIQDVEKEYSRLKLKFIKARLQRYFKEKGITIMSIIGGISLVFGSIFGYIISRFGGGGGGGGGGGRGGGKCPKCGIREDIKKVLKWSLDKIMSLIKKIVLFISSILKSLMGSVGYGLTLLITFLITLFLSKLYDGYGNETN